MAFVFDGRTKSDSAGVSAGWQRRVKAGVVAAVMAGLTMAPNAQAASPENHASESGRPQMAHAMPYEAARLAANHVAKNIFDTGISGFDADERNASSDPRIREAERNTVLILRYVESDDDAPASQGASIEVGSGTVIQDSQNKQGFNGILTAGHVIGQPIGKRLEGKDPCSGEGVICAAFSENGRPLGRLHVRSFPDEAKAKGNPIYQGVWNDAVVMDIEPYDAQYKALPGVRLAPVIPDSVVTAHTKKEYASGDGSIMTLGVTQGMSGGGVYSADGLVGVVSSGMNVHLTEKGDYGFYLDTFSADERMSRRGNANLIDVVASLPGVDKVTGIPRSMLTFSAMALDKAHAMPENYTMVAPVTGVIHALGDAGHDSHVGRVENQSLTMMGNPMGQAMTVTGVVKEAMPFGENPSFEPRVVNDKDQDLIKGHPVRLSMSKAM